MGAPFSEGPRMKSFAVAVAIGLGGCAMRDIIIISMIYRPQHQVMLLHNNVLRNMYTRRHWCTRGVVIYGMELVAVYTWSCCCCCFINVNWFCYVTPSVRPLRHDDFGTYQIYDVSFGGAHTHTHTHSSVDSIIGSITIVMIC